MFSNDEYTVLERGDMALLDMLFEQKLPDAMKSYLFELFKAGGVRESVLVSEDEKCTSCELEGECDTCWYAAPVRADTLIECICEIVDSFNWGNLEPLEGSFVGAGSSAEDDCYSCADNRCTAAFECSSNGNSEERCF